MTIIKKLIIVIFLIKIFVFIDWLIYYYIDTIQRDASFQIIAGDVYVLPTGSSSHGTAYSPQT